MAIYQGYLLLAVIVVFLLECPHPPITYEPEPSKLMLKYYL